jgi:hypothetical protein
MGLGPNDFLAADVMIFLLEMGLLMYQVQA